MIAFLKKFNTQLILISVIFAITLGIITPQIFSKISFLGDIFIDLLKLFALPLICSALIAALGGMGNNLSNLKSLANGVVGYMLLSEIIAVTISLILFNMFKPGVGLDPNLILHGKPYTVENQNALTIANFLQSIIPHNIFEALAKFDLLPVVIFSILFGIACAIIREKANPVINFAISVREVATTCLHGVMLLSPIGIFALVGAGIAESSINGNLANNFASLIKFVGILFLGLLFHALWQLILVVIASRQNPINILKASIPVFSTAFATSSSVATLPVAMETADNLKSNPNATRFMLPLCATINIGGMMMYEVGAALFFSQMLGFDLSLGHQILLAFACIMGGMAEGGIPETSLVSLVVVFKIVNVPLSAISILLPLDRIIDRFRTMVNIFGNMCGVIVVSQLIRKNKI